MVVELESVESNVERISPCGQNSNLEDAPAWVEWRFVLLRGDAYVGHAHSGRVVERLEQHLESGGVMVGSVGGALVERYGALATVVMGRSWGVASGAFHLEASIFA